jgi:uncharacterized DUF497 family protein
VIPTLLIVGAVAGMFSFPRLQMLIPLLVVAAGLWVVFIGSSDILAVPGSRNSEPRRRRSLRMGTLGRLRQVSVGRRLVPEIRSATDSVIPTSYSAGMLRISQVICDERHDHHIARHAVTCEEVEEVVLSPHSVFERSGRHESERRYRVLGVTATGLHLFVVVAHIGGGAVVVVTARGMDDAKVRRWRTR